ncbi:LuxR C-terminal-related transcriptional regulator [Streptomyces sp. YIM S03343]
MPRTFVRRARLTERLTQGVRGPLTLIAGAAGAGKTMLAADWARTADAPRRTAWLTVEAEDNAPGVFWTYVLAALRRHGLDGPDGSGGPDDIGSPARPGEVDHSLLARLAARLGSAAEPVVLVLDEFDRVAACAELADELQFVLRHSGGGLRLVIVSRSEPLLPLHRYRAAGEVTDIRGADLAFRPEEAAALLDRHGMPLSDTAVRALTERTGGWAAGLRLCILAAQRAADPETFLKDFEAGRSTLADYLLAEVLEAQPRATQDLLLRCSVLDRIHPDVANALTGRDDAETVLAGLQRANAFVDATGHSWYRLHPLFAEILRVHLRVREPGREPGLHRTAARRLADAGLLAEALPHAADAGDWELAAGLLVEDLGIGRLLTGLDAERLDTLFARMPSDVPGPAAGLVRAARDLVRHDADRGLAHLYRAAAALHHENASDALRLSCALMRVLAARTTGAADLAETAALEAEAARRALPAERLARHPELPVLILGDLGSAQLWAGRLDSARATLTAAAGADGGPATASLRQDCLGRLALIDVLHGRPGPARTHARQAVAEAERAGLPPDARAPVARLVLAAVATDCDELAEAHRHLDQAAACASATAPHDPVVTAVLALQRARLRLAQGDPAAALVELDGLEKPSTALEPSPWVHERAAVTACAAHLAAGRPEAALRVFEERPADSTSSRAAEARARLADGSPRAALDLLDQIPANGGEGPAIAVRVLLTRAAAADALGDTAAAQRLVSRALRLARPDRLRRPVLEAGPWLRRLLRAAPHLAHGHTWLPASVAAHHTTDTAADAEAAPFVVEPLSEREREVLQRLAQLLSTEEIAADLYLSVNTVKTHLKSVYRKLGATRRGEAVRRARELRLL